MIALGGFDGRFVLSSGRFGVRPSEIGTGGDFPSPLAACVDAGDDNTEFLWVIKSPLPSSGVLTANDDGGVRLLNAADGAYNIGFSLYTWGAGGPLISRGDSFFTVAVGVVAVTNAGGIGSTLTIGVPTLNGALQDLRTVDSAGGIASTLGFGTPTFTRLAVYPVTVVSIDSTLTVGTPSIAGDGVYPVSGVGAIASTLAIGAPTVTRLGGVSAVTNAGAIASTLTFGVPTVQVPGADLIVSPARTYRVQPDHALIPGEPHALPTWEKDCEAVLDYTVDWTDVLDMDGEQVSEMTISVPAGITLVRQAASGLRMTAVIGGGAGGKSYAVKFKVFFNAPDPREDARTIMINVKRV